jgi:hypothetical protein
MPYKFGDYIYIKEKTFDNDLIIGNVYQVREISVRIALGGGMFGRVGVFKVFELPEEQLILLSDIRLATDFETAHLISRISETFNVDDWVVITKSSTNWAPAMDEFDKKVVKIIAVNINSIKFKGGSTWSWRYQDGHFRKATPKEIEKVTNNNQIKINNEENMSMKIIKEVLEKVYNNLELRKTVVPLFMGNTGLGKTHIIKDFANSVGAHLELFLTSAKPPFEIDGIGVPNTKRTKAVHVEFENILKLKDGDILFLDEMPNGNLATLNAFLTFVESRITAAGRKLPDIMIVAAGNYQGMSPMTPQIKERFVWYDVKFDAKMWKEFMFNKYKMHDKITDMLCNLIHSEEFMGYNFNTPRSLDKAVNLIINDVPTPYSVILKPILQTLINNPIGKRIRFSNTDRYLEADEMISWLELKQLENGIIKK